MNAGIHITSSQFLATMSDDEIKHLREDLASVAAVAPSIGRIVGLIRMVIGVGVASIGTFAVGVMWISNKASAIDSTQIEVAAIKADRIRAESAWSEWRRSKDDLDIRIITLLENYQSNLAAIARSQDRQQEQLNRLESSTRIRQ